MARATRGGITMFEKEDEDNKPPYVFCTFDTNCELWKDGFQKGAEMAVRIIRNKINGICYYCLYGEKL